MHPCIWLVLCNIIFHDVGKLSVLMCSLRFIQIVYIFSENLIQHIDQFISEDITEVINELSSIVDAEELKQSVIIAKELRVNIAASEDILKAEASDVLDKEVLIPQIQLAQQLHSALATLEHLPLDTLGEISTINKEILEKVAEITGNLQTDLAAVIDVQNVIEQTDEAKLEQKSIDTAQLKISEPETAIETIAEQRGPASEEPIADKLITATDIKEIVTDEISSEHTIAQASKSEELVSETDAVLEKHTADQEISQNLPITSVSTPICLEEVTLSIEEEQATAKAVEKPEKPHTTATIGKINYEFEVVVKLTVVCGNIFI